MLSRAVFFLLTIFCLLIFVSTASASGLPPVFHNPNAPFDDNPVSIAISVDEARSDKFVRFVKDSGDVTDPEGDTLSFSLVAGGDTSKFNIDSGLGDLYTNNVTDFEAPYCSDNTCIVYVRAFDGTSSTTQRYDITILDVNEPPAVADQSFDVEEGSLNGVSVGTVVANDPEGDAISYTITSQSTPGLFALNSGSGEITVADESSLGLNPSTHTINVQTQSAGPLTDTAVVTVNVIATTNVAPTDVQLFPDTVPTGTDTSSGHTVGNLRAYDANQADTHTFSIEGGVDSAKFSISGTQLILQDTDPPDGKVNYKSPTDSDVDAVYEVLVRATDSGNLNKWLEKTVRVKVVIPMLHTGHTMRSDKWGGDWGTKASGAKYGEFKCETCHGKKTGNIKRVKGTITTPDNSDWESSLSADLAVNFQKVVDGDSDFGDDSVAHATSNFICEVCHSQNRFHNYNSAGNLANDHENKADCTRCHQHKNAFRGTGDACNICHGNATSKAPATGAHAVHTNFITADKDNGSFDASDCDLCHSSVLSGNATGSLQYSYDPDTDRLNGYNHSDPLGRILELNGSVGYNETDKTCSNACHQSAVSDGYWDDPNGLNCDACHYYAALPTAAGNGSNPTPLLGNHSNHFEPDFTSLEVICTDCHGTLETQGAGPLSHKHAKDTSTDALWLTSQGKDYLNPGGQDVNVDDSAQNAGDGNTWVNSPITTDAGNTCSNSRCHNPSPGASFKADWDGSIDPCTGCHGYNDIVFGAPDIVSGSHDAHLNMDPDISVWPSSGRCGVCHGSNVHMNGNVDLEAGWTYSSASLNQPEITQDFKATSWGSCTITECHEDGTGLPVDSPEWGQDGGANCDTCHGVATNGIPQSNAHSAHLQDLTYVPTVFVDSSNNSTQTAYNFGCTECHTSNKAFHARQGTVNMNAAVGFNITTDKCATSDCHSNGAGSYTESPAWTGTWSGDKCAGCHGNSPNTNAHEDHEVGIHYNEIYTGSSGLKAAGNTATSMHGNSNTSTTISCYLCHNDTVTTKANAANVTCDACHDPAGGDAGIGDEVAVIADKRKHVNRTVEVAFNSVRVKTTAQLRDDISSVGELSASWLRLDGTGTEDNSGGGYKKDDAYDIFQAAKSLDTATMYNATNLGCTVACHNDYYIEWQPATSNCMLCHKALPQ